MNVNLVFVYQHLFDETRHSTSMLNVFWNISVPLAHTHSGGTSYLHL